MESPLINNCELLVSTNQKQGIPRESRERLIGLGVGLSPIGEAERQEKYSLKLK